jgi:hypothetical protein
MSRTYAPVSFPIKFRSRRSQSGPEYRNYFSSGNGQVALNSDLSAMALWHWTTAW